MKSAIRSQIKLFAFLALAALLLFFAFRGVDYDTVLKGFRNANYLWVGLAMLAGLGSYVIRSLRWQILIEPLGKKPSVKNTFNALMLGYLANLAFPRMGEITRCISLRKTDGLPFESLVGTVIVERALDVLVMLLLFVVVFFARINFFGKFLIDNVVISLFNKVKVLINISPVIPILIVVLIIIVIVLIRQNVFGNKFKQKINSLYWGVIDGLKSVLKTKKRKAFILYTIAMWFCYWLMTWLIFFAISATSHLGVVDGLFLLVVGSLGMAAPVQGGFGAFHFIIALALGIYGVTWEDGLVYAIISHESQMLLVLIVGSISMLVLFFQRKSSKLPNETAKK